MSERTGGEKGEGEGERRKNRRKKDDRHPKKRSDDHQQKNDFCRRGEGGAAFAFRKKFSYFLSELSRYTRLEVLKTDETLFFFPFFPPFPPKHTEIVKKRKTA